MEKRLPLGAGRPWLCSFADVDWQAEGFGRRDLEALLGRIGLFFDAHRAFADVAALMHMLDHMLPSGKMVVGHMLLNAQAPSWALDAVDAPFSAKDVLKDRGWRWDAERKLWSTVVGGAALEEEVGWARMMLYGGRRGPVAREVDWTRRWAATG